MTHFSPSGIVPAIKSPSVDYGLQAMDRRACILRAADIAAGLEGSQLQQFFTRQGGVGRRSALISPSATAIKFQQYHESPGVIDDGLANLRCFQAHPDWLLYTLNDVLGTPNRTLGPEGTAVLQTFLNEDFDFGQIYGMLRPWWSEQGALFNLIPQRMLQRKQEDRKMRRSAMDGECIVNSHIPPRRVWDLYSNRVLPYHALNIPHPHDIPSNLWAVSHSWLHPHLRHFIHTPINQRLWPIPIPSVTTLEHVRIELLNMGAEYVFLDVLCLRQKGDPYWEFIRKREWKLDVPTIGHIYQAALSQTTVTYFNGLGVKFDVSPPARQETTHWFNRVWTTQEATLNWVPGGIADASPFQGSWQSEWGEQFSSSLKNILSATRRELDKVKLYDIVQVIRDRAFAMEVDRVSSMAYLLRCDTLPVYDENADVEDVWGALVQHMPPRFRTDLLMTWPWPGKGKCHWRPSWSNLVDKKLVLPTGDTDPFAYTHNELLQFESHGRFNDWDAYYHWGYFIPISGAVRLGELTHSFTIPRSGQTPLVIQMQGYFDDMKADGYYYLTGVRNGGIWVVGRNYGRTTVGSNTGPVVQKIGTVTVMNPGDAKLLGETLDRDHLQTFITYF